MEASSSLRDQQLVLRQETRKGLDVAENNNEHIPNDDERKVVIALSSFGINQEDISRYLNIDPKTLRKYYRSELDKSKIKTNLEVAKSLFRNATENENVSAQMFWLKTQAGWRDVSAVEHSNPDGNMGGKTIIATPEALNSIVDKL